MNSFFCLKPVPGSRGWAVMFLLLMMLSACGSRGKSVDAAPEPTPEAAPASKPAEAPPAPQISCVPVKPKAESSAQGKAAAKPAAKPAARSKTPVKAAKGTKPNVQSLPVASEPVSADANGVCPPGTEKVIKEAAAAPAKPAKPEPAKAEPVKATVKDDQPRMGKSVDGSFEGEIYGSPVSGCKLGSVKIGMLEREVQKIAGYPDDQTSHTTAKAFIPFYMGPDTHRRDHIYAGCGRVSYSPGDIGARDGRLVVVEIRHDPKTR